MTEPPMVEMISQFPRWYGDVEIANDPEKLKRRWVGVSKLAENATRADIEAMIRVAFRTKQKPSPVSLQSIRKTFKDADDLFEMDGNSREIEVLCGASLAAILTSGGDAAAMAALSLTTAALGRSLKTDLALELTKLADTAILEIAEANRERPDLTEDGRIEQPNLDFDKAIAKVREQANAEGFAIAFKLAADTTRAAIGKVARGTARALAAVERFIAMQDEELQMLWWLTGQRSWDLDCAFAAIPPEAQPLVLSKELAQTTQFMPGPISVRALLSRAGLRERGKLTVPASVNACDTQWLTGIVDELSPSPVTQPIHFAIKRRLETEEIEAWVAGWAATTEIEATQALSPLALGNSFYRERLLAIFSGD